MLICGTHTFIHRHRQRPRVKQQKTLWQIKSQRIIGEIKINPQGRPEDKLSEEGQEEKEVKSKSQQWRLYKPFQFLYNYHLHFL